MNCYILSLFDIFLCYKQLISLILEFGPKIAFTIINYAQRYVITTLKVEQTSYAGLCGRVTNSNRALRDEFICTRG